MSSEADLRNPSQIHIPRCGFGPPSGPHTHGDGTKRATWTHHYVLRVSSPSMGSSVDGLGAWETASGQRASRSLSHSHRLCCDIRPLTFIASPVRNKNTGRCPCRHIPACEPTVQPDHHPCRLWGPDHISFATRCILTPDPPLKYDRTSRPISPFTSSLCPKTTSIPNSHYGTRHQPPFGADHARPFVGISLLYHIPGDNNDPHQSYFPTSSHP